MKKKLFLGEIILLLLMPIALYSNYIDYIGFGNNIGIKSLSSFLKGGSGLTDDPLLNPANIIDKKAFIKTTIGFCYETESESQTIFDKYNNRIGKVITSQDQGTHIAPYSIFIGGKYSNIGWGIYSGMSRDYYYKHENINRNSYYQIIDKVIDKSEGIGLSSGILSAYSFNISEKINFSLGINLNYLKNNNKTTYNHIYYEEGIEDTLIESEYNSSGLVYRLGSKFDYNNLSFGMSFSTSNSDINEPSTVGIGLSYKSPGIIPGVIFLDFNYNFNKQLNDSLYDTKSYHFGIDNQFGNNINFIMGAGYKENTFNKEASSAFFTSGFKYCQNNIAFSLGFVYSQKNYNKTQIIEIENSSIDFILGLEYSL